MPAIHRDLPDAAAEAPTTIEAQCQAPSFSSLLLSNLELGDAKVYEP